MDWECTSDNLFDFNCLALNFCEHIALFVTNATLRECDLNSGWVSYDLNNKACRCRIVLARIWLSAWLKVGNGGTGVHLVDGHCLDTDMGAQASTVKKSWHGGEAGISWDYGCTKKSHRQSIRTRHYFERWERNLFVKR